MLRQGCEGCVGIVNLPRGIQRSLQNNGLWGVNEAYQIQYACSHVNSVALNYVYSTSDSRRVLK